MSPELFRPGQPYNALPMLPPAADLNSRRILRACIGARAALAALDVTADLIPNPAILINTIPILEARASSEIENIVTTADSLFRFAAESAEPTDPAVKEALRSRTALRRGSTRPVTTNLAIDVCTVLRGIDTDVRRIPGTALRNQGTGETVYTPPDGEGRLRSMLANWEAFLHGHDDVDPLVRMAVGHYQFEAVHPFEDGNGRTGRILNLLYLVEQGLLRLPILYLSGAIIRSKSEYYRRLLQVTTAARWEDWICYVLGLVERTSRWTSGKVRAIRDLLRETASIVRERAPRIYSRELVDLVFVQPYCRIGNVVDAGLARRQTASTYLAKLADLGVLTPVKAGREKLFINRTLLDLLAADTNGDLASPSPDASEIVPR